jgi:hypothetical protein
MSHLQHVIYVVYIIEFISNYNSLIFLLLFRLYASMTT